MNSLFSFWNSTPADANQVNEVKEDSFVEKNEPVKHSNCFKIVVILDESGSMQCIQQDMIKSINDLIREQKQITNRRCKFTLVKFNDEVNRIIKNIDLQQVYELTTEDYVPNRSTALYDAIGNTVDWFRYERDVLMVIITDGQENSSRKYNRKQIAEMLDEKQKYCNWTYVYLCNDLSTSTQGNNIGCKTSSFCSNSVVQQSGYGDFIGKNINSAISNYRKSGVSVQSQLNSDPTYHVSITRRKI